MIKDKIIEYLSKSTLENRLNWPIKNGVFVKQNSIMIQFNSESWILKFNNEKSLPTDIEFTLYHRDSRESRIITEDEFFTYLDILIEMDLLRQNQIKLRKLIIYSDIKDYIRNRKLNKILNGDDIR